MQDTKVYGKPVTPGVERIDGVFYFARRCKKGYEIMEINAPTILAKIRNESTERITYTLYDCDELVARQCLKLFDSILFRGYNLAYNVAVLSETVGVKVASDGILAALQDLIE